MFTQTLPSFPSIGLAVLLSALLAGCAATQLDANVHTVGSWPQGRAPGTFAFERLPSQQARADEQARLEAAAQPALEQAGFKLATGAPADVRAHLARGAAEADFLTAKRITAHHYALHVLPEAGALRDAVVHGAVTTLGLSDAQF